MGSKTKSYTGKLDIERDWASFGGEATLRFGGQYDHRKSIDPGAKALLRPNGQAGSLSLRQVAAELGVPWTPGAMVTGTPFDETLERGYSTNYLNTTTILHPFAVFIAQPKAETPA